MGYYDLLLAAIFLAVVMILANRFRASDKLIGRVRNVLRVAGWVWYLGSVVWLFTLVADFKAHPELWAIKDESVRFSDATAAAANLSRMVKPAQLDLTTLNLTLPGQPTLPGLQKKVPVESWDARIDNAATYKHLFEVMTGPVAAWLAVTFTLMALNLWFANYRLRWIGKK